MSVLTRALLLGISALALSCEPVREARGQPSTGGGSGSCDCDCEESLKDCKSNIDRLGPLCRHNPSLKLICQEGKQRGCKAVKTYCEVMCDVRFEPCDPDPEPPPPPPGQSSGEPHIRTLDGVSYDLQSVGEFVLAETSDGRLVVHTRQSPVGERVSLNSAVGIHLDGKRIAIDLRDTGSETPVVWDGTPVSITELDGRIRDGVMVDYFYDALMFARPGVGAVRVYLGGSFMNVYVAPPDDVQTRGLLGNHDGDPDNDVVPPQEFVDSGAPLADWMHGAYADSLRITDAVSLLPYREGESTETFTDRSFPRALPALTAAAMAGAEQVCRRAGLTNPADLRDCAYDVAVTGDESFAQHTPQTRYRGARQLDLSAPPVRIAFPISWDGYDPKLPPAHWAPDFQRVCAYEGGSTAYCACAWARFEEEAAAYAGQDDVVQMAAFLKSRAGSHAGSWVIQAINGYYEANFDDRGSFEAIQMKSKYTSPRYKLLTDAVWNLEERCAP